MIQTNICKVCRKYTTIRLMIFNKYFGLYILEIALHIYILLSNEFKLYTKDFYKFSVFKSVYNIFY